MSCTVEDGFLVSQWKRYSFCTPLSVSSGAVSLFLGGDAVGTSEEFLAQMLRVGCCPQKHDIWLKQITILDVHTEIHLANKAIATGKAMQTHCRKLVVTSSLDMAHKIALHKNYLSC